MSHMIDTTTGKAAIAYVGAKPWHGLGQELTAGAPLETWITEAGLDWTAEKASVEYTVHGEDGKDEVRSFDKKAVIYRSDTKQPLSVVSKDGYKIVQPKDIMEFFRSLLEGGGFHMETAGALSNGARIWALAKAGEGAKVIGQDEIRPYLLAATSFDGTLASTFKFVCERVVCHNTISIAFAETVAKTKDTRYTGQVKVGHNTSLNMDAVKAQLGLVHGAFDQFLTRAQALAEKKMTAKLAEKVTFELIRDVLITSRKAEQTAKIKESRRFNDIMDLFNGKAIGSDLTKGKTAWQYLNSITEYADHHMGNNDNNRMNSAWFGQGDALKTAAAEKLAEV